MHYKALGTAKCFAVAQVGSIAKAHAPCTIHCITVNSELALNPCKVSGIGFQSRSRQLVLTAQYNTTVQYQSVRLSYALRRFSISDGDAVSRKTYLLPTVINNYEHS